MKYRILFLLGLCSLVYKADAEWTLNQSPSTETFNGISAADNYFAIGVGKNGSIVHFDNDNTGYNANVIASGTSNELFDVYTASKNLAVASGRDVVLLWDGSSWSKIVDSKSNTPFTGSWITPEEDVVFYQSLGFFNFICPHLPGVPSEQQPFCRAFSNPMLAACGKSNDIKFFTSDGDIHHLNNSLAEISGTADIPLHNEKIPLNLTAVYIPETSCPPMGIAPINVYAIRNTNEFWKFDGEVWANMNVPVPAGQTLSWLSGVSSSKIVAVGFKPDGFGGNAGVIWNYDGTSWSEETNLPSGLLGLTDVSASLGPVDPIFASGFDTNLLKHASTQKRVDILAAAEAGTYIDLFDVLPVSLIDLKVTKTLLNSGPIKVNDIITFQLEVKNIGNEAAVNVSLIDGYINNIHYQSDDCGMTVNSFNQEENSTFRKKIFPLIATNQSVFCTITFQVIGPAGEEIKNLGYAKEEEYQFDENFINNTDLIKDIIIQPE